MASSPRQYPAMVYHEESSTIVNSQEEFDALGAGWYDSPTDVPAMQDKADPVTGQVPAAEFNAAAVDTARSLPTPIGPNSVPRDRLEYQAEGLGIKVDKRWSNETLRAKIFEIGSV